jgi:hypothetical protein
MIAPEEEVPAQEEFENTQNKKGMINEFSPNSFSPLDISSNIKIPPFITKEKLLTIDLENHLNRVLENEQEKQIFLQMFWDYFCSDPKIDLQQYHSPNYDPFGEKQFLLPINGCKMEQLGGLRIAAVDGGLGWRKYLGIQMTLIKAAVVLYEFNGKNIPKISNYEPSSRDSNYQFYTDYCLNNENHGTLLAGFRRCIAENRLLMEFLESDYRQPDIVLLDGSLCIPPSPFYIDNEDIQDFYRLCVQSYLDLYNFCEKHRILLVGSIKDSKSTIFRDLLNRSFPFFLQKYSSLSPFYKVQYPQIFRRFTDTELLFKILPPNTRTVAFQYFDNNKIERNITNSPPLQNENSLSQLNQDFCPDEDPENRNVPINKSSNKNAFPLPVYASYLQFSQVDLPLRLEFLSSLDTHEINRRIEQIASILSPITGINPICTLPLPQVEAHMRAHLPAQELDMVAAQLERLFQTKNLLDWDNPVSMVKSGNTIFNSPELPLKIKSFYSTFMDKRHSRLPF